MHPSRTGAALALILLAAAPARAQEKAVTLGVVKYAGLKDAVLKNRGKVVLVDFWANY